MRKKTSSGAIIIKPRKDPEWEKLSPKEKARRTKLIKKVAAEARERVSHSCNAFIPSGNLSAPGRSKRRKK